MLIRRLCTKSRSQDKKKKKPFFFFFLQYAFFPKLRFKNNNKKTRNVLSPLCVCCATRSHKNGVQNGAGFLFFSFSEVFLLFSPIRPCTTSPPPPFSRHRYCDYTTIIIYIYVQHKRRYTDTQEIRYTNRLHTYMCALQGLPLIVVAGGVRSLSTHGGRASTASKGVRTLRTPNTERG